MNKMKVHLKRLNTNTINDEENKSTKVTIEYEISYATNPIADALLSLVKKTVKPKDLHDIHPTIKIDTNVLKFYFTTESFIKIKDENMEYDPTILYTLCVNANHRKSMQIQNKINRLILNKWQEYSSFLNEICDFNKDRILMMRYDFHRRYDHGKMTNKEQL